MEGVSGLLFNLQAMDTPTLEVLLAQYVQYCAVIRNYAQTTLKGYRNNCGWFLRESGVVYPSDLSRHVFEEWFYKGRLERKWSSATFRHYHKYLNTFVKWLIKEGHLDLNPLVDIEKPRMEQRLPKTLTKDEAQKILDASYHVPYSYTFERYRNRALIGVMLFAGLRRGEALNLKLNDVSLIEHTLFINQGKGAKDRMVPVNGKLALILDEYLKDRRRLKKQCPYLFTAVQKDQKLEHRALVNLITRIKKSTKLKFSAHTLRHAFARLMLEGGCDIYTLSKLMGHTKITTTTIYLACSSQQMSKAVEMHMLN
jgi:site-specific recombinase XerD